MTQTDLCFDAECSVPPRGTMSYDLLMALKRGEKLTPLSALNLYKCFSLSQRMGELRRSGWPIVAVMVKLQSGKKVAEYHLQEQVAA